MAMILLGTIEFQEAKRIRARLEELGVRIEITVQPESCGVGCKPVADAYVEEEDLPKAREFFAAERARDHGEGFDPDRFNHVFDTEKEDATCPACGTSFKTSMKECPDCGLVFLTEEPS